MLIKLAESVLSYLRARETEAALADLSDAALDDIGMTRAGLRRPPARPAARPEAAGPTEPLFAPVAQAA